jgi:hypothetical protein
MSVRHRGARAALIAVLFVAGCAGNSASPGAPSAPGGAPTSAQSSTQPSTDPSAGQPSAGAETLTGTVEAGVEPGCLVLKGSGKDHLLVFDQQSLKSQAKPGSSITVTGTAKPGQLTTCQQGIPFIVTSLRVD